MADGERYRDVFFPEYYEDIFSEDDLDFRFRLIRTHIHPKLRLLLTGCLDEVADVLETDPFTFSRMERSPKRHDAQSPLGGGDEPGDCLRCALYKLRPNDVRGSGFPNLRSSSGRGRHIADFDLSFFAQQDGVGLELRMEGQEELRLLEEVYDTYRDPIDALMTFVRLSVDGPSQSPLLSIAGMIKAAKEARRGWLAIFDTRYPYPVAAPDFMARFEDCFLSLYLVYDAMLSRALGIEDHFLEQFARVEEHYRHKARVDLDPPTSF